MSTGYHKGSSYDDIIRDLDKRLRQVELRGKHPALQNAYNEYKLIETLIGEDHDATTN